MRGVPSTRTMRYLPTASGFTGIQFNTLPHKVEVPPQPPPPAIPRQHSWLPQLNYPKTILPGFFSSAGGSHHPPVDQISPNVSHSLNCLTSCCSTNPVTMICQTRPTISNP
ncbi:hypothetical protein DUI87_08194 [Hirundo rustica rustica]|uniref:Uncharacterized protein n=1 Tax=Hirundo rustica rustica TaxID=333673 RepID=A0A3M0L9S0_HIRRU|nr:hypothetical protein DUI87_08194 [Hirundo rustica rustica]